MREEGGKGSGEGLGTEPVVEPKRSAAAITQHVQQRWPSEARKFLMNDVPQEGPKEWVRRLQGQEGNGDGNMSSKGESLVPEAFERIS